MNLLSKRILALFFIGVLFLNNISVNAVSNIDDISLKSDTWVSGIIPELPLPRYNMTVDVVDDKIYVSGGVTASYTHLFALEMYNPVTGLWESKPDMSTRRSGHVSAVIGDEIFYIGGENQNGVLNSVEVYNTKTDTWRTATSMPTARTSATAVVLNNEVYVIGGTNNTANYSTVEIYNPETNSWRSSAALPSARRKLSSTVVDNNIYVFGGWESGKGYINTTQVYNSERGAWEERTYMPTKRGSFQSVLINGKIHCIGGENDFGCLDNVEIYDPATNTWDRGNSMPVERGNFGVALLGNKIICIGGRNSSIVISSSDAFEFYVPQKPQTSHVNIDVYIKPQNILSVNLSLNSITFSDFDGVNDLEYNNALNIGVDSNLPYDITATLESRISNSDRSKFMDNRILKIKSNLSTNYKDFVDIGTPVLLLENQLPQLGANHGIDFLLKGGIPYEVDVYRATVKFEVSQK